MSQWSIIGKPTTYDWTEVSKAAETSVFVTGGGEPIGLLMALTYAETQSSVLTGWGITTKPTVSSWITVAKPTN